MKIAILIIMFFVIGALFIISENNLALNKAGNADKAIGLYLSWLSDVFDNGRTVTGYVLRMNWLPENKSG